MRTGKTRMVVLAMAAGLLMPVACHKSTSGNEDDAAGKQTGQKSNSKTAGNTGSGQKQGGGGNTGSTLTEPADSTTGVPAGPVAAASDDGSPGAVSHTSTAMPGAPEATVPRGQAKPGQAHDKKAGAATDNSGPQP